MAFNPNSVFGVYPDSLWQAPETDPFKIAAGIESQRAVELQNKSREQQIAENQQKLDQIKAIQQALQGVDPNSTDALLSAIQGPLAQFGDADSLISINRLRSESANRAADNERQAAQALLQVYPELAPQLAPMLGVDPAALEGVDFSNMVPKGATRFSPKQGLAVIGPDGKVKVLAQAQGGGEKAKGYKPRLYTDAVTGETVERDLNDPATEDAVAQGRLKPYIKPDATAQMIEMLSGSQGRAQAPRQATQPQKKAGGSPPPGLSFEEFQQWKRENASR